MGGIPNGYVAADAIRGIFDAVPDQVPMKCIFEGLDTLQTMTRHFMGIFMAAGAQPDNFSMGPAPAHAVRKMGVKILGPFLLGVTADAAGQGFIGQSRAVAPHPVQRDVHAIAVAVFAGGQILGKRFGIVGRSGPMDAIIKFLDHVDMRKFLIGGGLLYVAFGGTINFLDIGVRDFIEADMTIFTFQFAVNRAGKLFIVDVKNPFGPAFIKSSDAGISMAQQAVFRVGKGVGSEGRDAGQQQKQSG